MIAYVFQNINKIIKTVCDRLTPQTVFTLAGLPGRAVEPECFLFGTFAGGCGCGGEVCAAARGIALRPSRPAGEENVRGGGKAVAALQRGDKGGQVPHERGEGQEVRHAAGEREMGEHRLVVGGIAEEEDLAQRVRLAEHLAQEELRHGELVVIAEPGVHVDGAHLGPRAHGFADGADAPGVREGEDGRLLGEIDRQVVDAGELILGHAAAGHGGQAGVAHGQQAVVNVGRGHAGVGEDLQVVFAVQIVDDGPVLPHHGRHRPFAGDEVAPAAGAARDGNDAQAGVVQPPEGAVGLGGQPAAVGEGVVDVGEQIAHGARLGGRQLRNWFHGDRSFAARGAGAFLISIVCAELIVN